MNIILIPLIVSMCLFDTIFPESISETGNCVWTTDTTGITLDLSGLKYYDSYDQFSGATYRYYPCSVTEDWDQYTCKAVNNPALCQRNSDGSVYLVGKLGSVNMKVMTSTANSATFEASYSGGDGDRMGTITITCFKSEDSFSFDYESYPAYFFSFSVKTAACYKGTPAGQEGGNAPAFFLILLIVSLIAATTYVVAGVLIMYFYKKARGVALIPNLEFWKDFPFLLKDGFLFTFSCYPPFREWIGNKPGIGNKGGDYEKL